MVYSSIESPEIVLRKLERVSMKETCSIKVGEALCSPKYRTSFFVQAVMMIFHGLTGYSTILSYSTVIFSKMGGKITPH